MSAVETRVKEFMDLRPGDVIKAPDGTLHTVTDIGLHILGDYSEFTTDTGLRIGYHTWYEVLCATYDVVIPAAVSA